MICDILCYSETINILLGIGTALLAISIPVVFFLFEKIDSSLDKDVIGDRIWNRLICGVILIFLPLVFWGIVSYRFFILSFWVIGMFIAGKYMVKAHSLIGKDFIDIRYDYLKLKKINQDSPSQWKVLWVPCSSKEVGGGTRINIEDRFLEIFFDKIKASLNGNINLEIVNNLLKDFSINIDKFEYLFVGSGIFEEVLNCYFLVLRKDGEGEYVRIENVLLKLIEKCIQKSINENESGLAFEIINRLGKKEDWEHVKKLFNYIGNDIIKNSGKLHKEDVPDDWLIKKERLSGKTFTNSNSISSILCNHFFRHFNIKDGNEMSYKIKLFFSNIDIQFLAIIFILKRDGIRALMENSFEFEERGVSEIYTKEIEEKLKQEFIKNTFELANIIFPESKIDIERYKEQIGSFLNTKLPPAQFEWQKSLFLECINGWINSIDVKL